jgi:two-component system response regulator AlgR
MNIIIADDEALARQRLKRLLSDLSPSYTICAEAENGLDALNLCQQHNANIILLDIRMPIMDGLQTAMEINKSNIQTSVIFTTAYDQHALDAFESNAIDYLLKPVKKARLSQALEKAERFSSSTARSIAETSGKLIAPRQHLCAHSHAGINLIKVNDVLCFKAEHKYVTAFTTTETVLLDDSLKSLENEFPTLFTRIHRNALVNINAVQRFHKNSDGQYHVLLDQLDEPMIVSRRHIAEIRKLLQHLQ